MASIKTYVNGAGGSTGAALATIKPLQTTGVIYYLGNATAGASDSNAGTDRSAPVATLAHAYSLASAGDIIDVLAGHNEVLGSGVALNKSGLSLVGEGSGALVPKFTTGSGVSIGIEVQASTLLDNLQFGPSLNAAGITLQLETLSFCNALIFNTGANETSGAMAIVGTANACDGSRFTNITFTSGSALGYALEMSVNHANLVFDNVVFDGSSFGWSTYAWRIDGTITNLRVTGLQLLNGSDMLIGTNTKAYMQVSEQSGSSQIDWTP